MDGYIQYKAMIRRLLAPASLSANLRYQAFSSASELVRTEPLARGARERGEGESITSPLRCQSQQEWPNV